MKYLLIYLLTGVVAVLIRCCIHIYKAFKRGYTLDIMNKVLDDNIDVKGSCMRAIICLIIWPIRIIQFTSEEYELMFLYNLETLEEMDREST